jgi:hypothetical protein
MKPVPTWPRFIAEVQRMLSTSEPFLQLDQRIGAVLHNPEVSDSSAPPFFGYGNDYCGFMHIQANILRGSFHLAHLPCMGLCITPGAVQPSNDCMQWDKPLSFQSANIGSKAITDPEHERHFECVEWIDRPFNSNSINADWLSQEVAKLASNTAERLG